MGRAVLDVWSTAWTAADLYEALRLLTRLIGMGSIGTASVAHVLTMLGGPMERMESWGPPGRNKRRPCKVRVCWPHGFSRFSSSGDREYWVYTALLGGVKNYHATEERDPLDLFADSDASGHASGRERAGAPLHDPLDLFADSDDE